ncbi:MAG: alpha/beta fold hydrolase [bacterium]|nr:alpha/beta fold hydrolase [bacterium]
MKALTVRMLTYIVAIYLSLAFLIYIMQDSYIFFPVRADYGDLSNFKNVEEYRLEDGKVELRGWLVNKEYAGDKLLIYYGGNAEDVYGNIMEHYDKKGYAILLVNYRGYGLSGGKSSEKSLFADAGLIYDDITSKYKPEKVILYGRSLGSGVAAYLSSVRKVTGMILVSPYDSMINMARERFRIFPVSIMLRHRFDSVKYLKNYRGPLCIIYGGSDNIVPGRRTKALIEHIRGPKEVVLIEGAGHNDIAGFELYERTVQKFIGKI